VRGCAHSRAAVIAICAMVASSRQQPDYAEAAGGRKIQSGGDAPPRPVSLYHARPRWLFLLAAYGRR
jgi:hypothetical protein